MLKRRKLSKIAGFALMESLVALLIISISMLGLAGLMTRMVTMEIESYQRAHALTLVKDMAERMKINSEGAEFYAISNSGSKTKFINNRGGFISSFFPNYFSYLTQCDSVQCISQPPDGIESPESRAFRIALSDLQIWENALMDSATSSSSIINESTLIEPRACIESINDGNEFRITVTWRGMSKTIIPPVSCAAGAYSNSDQKLRRAVSIIVSKTDLNCNHIKGTGC